MDVFLCSVALILFIFVICAVYFFKINKPKENVGAVAVGHNQPVARPRDVGPPGARGRRNRRLVARHNDDEDNSEVEEEELSEDDELKAAREDGKVGAKKLRKMEEKAARKAQREAEEEDRKEKKAREQKLEKERKKQEHLDALEEAARATEEQKLKEEQRKREEEEYLKLKQDFTVDEEGVDAIEKDDMENLLQEFLSYIKQAKVVMLEDLASRFKIKTQDAIDRIKYFQDEGQLSGIIDDRGKFIYITHEEYELVGKFIKQRGRVSISELADSMNRLINLNPDIVVSLPTPVSVTS